MCLAIAIYITAALKVRVAAPLDILVTSLMLVTAASVTAASYWHTHFRRRLPGPTFLYLQAVFDILLITLVVHMTGGGDSDLASLYVILIAATALLMPPPTPASSRSSRAWRTSPTSSGATAPSWRRASGCSLACS